jgi:hypothetical protein
MPYIVESQGFYELSVSIRSAYCDGFNDFPEHCHNKDRQFREVFRFSRNVQQRGSEIQRLLKRPRQASRQHLVVEMINEYGAQGVSASSTNLGVEDSRMMHRAKD